jgi:SAM-dependent methyltransferase
MATKQNIFEGGSKFDWAAYLDVRPDYTLNKFYSLIWDYHNEHNGKWTCVHDIGAGPGNVSEVLAKHFKQVFASDVSDFHMAVAAQRLSGMDNISFQVHRGEDVANSHPAGSADMVVAAESFALMDTEVAMASFAKLLRPGGTLAIWYYGGPIYTDDEHGRIQSLHRSITARGFDEFRPMKGTSWELVSTILFRWLDNISFPSENWVNLKRIKWNNDRPLAFEEEKEVDFEVPRVSSIRPDEKVTEIIDRTFWAKEASFAWAEAFIDAQIPRKSDYKIPEVHQMFEGLKGLMGGPEKKHKICFPAVLLLATRK